MKKHLPIFIFITTAVFVSVFILLTSEGLPEVVASHFNGQGRANGHMPKLFYECFMLAFTVGIPLVVIASSSLVSRFSDKRINIPNKQIWLSEKYREETFAYLRGHAYVMGSLISGFMGYIHWLVVRGNASTPAMISSHEIMVSVALFLLSIMGMSIMLPMKFMRLPKEGR
jgi:uncharacterized membrane protein